MKRLVFIAGPLPVTEPNTNWPCCAMLHQHESKPLETDGSLPDNPPLSETLHDPTRDLIGRAVAGANNDLRIFRRLIRRVDAGEILDLAFLCARVQALRVAPHALLEWRVDENFHELVRADELAHHLPFCSEG